MKKIVLLSFVFLASGIHRFALASENSGRAKEPAAFLNLGAGGKSLGMGKAFTSVADDGSAMVWNPAGLAQLKQLEFHAMSGIMEMDRKLYFLGLGIPIHMGTSYLDQIEEDEIDETSRKIFLPLTDWRLTVSLGALVYKVNNIDRRNDFGVKQGEFSDTEYAYLFSIGHDVLTDLMLGYTFKYFVQRLENSSAKGHAVDVATIYHPSLLPGSRFGISFQNIAGQLNWKSVDDLGVTDEYSEKINYKTVFGASYHLPKPGLLFALDMETFPQQTPVYHLGFEYQPIPLLALRAGLDEETPSMGFGFNQKLGSKMSIQTDYAYITSIKALVDTHRISVALRY